ncbi:MAG TPA: hypothetical protein VFM17_07370 [Candidatus Eisenbacteria bacterium]|nr:hypothetical protein [Candidatus Eisenbacteria bacterium]
MAGTLQLAWESAGKSIRSFSWREYAALAPLLAVQLLYLILGLNLGTALGMGTSGVVSRAIAGPASLDYPVFLELLPLTFSYVETVTFVLGGAIAIPMLVAAVLESGAKTAGPWRGRIRAAIVPTLLALGGAYALTYLWQQLDGAFVQSFARGLMGGGLSGALGSWILSAAVSLAITTFVVYVPVAAVAEDVSGRKALARGLDIGRRLFGPTFLFVFLLSIPALLLQFSVQFMGTMLTLRTRPENIAYALIAYAVLSSLATYFVWGTAARVHRGLAAANGGIA